MNWSCHLLLDCTVNKAQKNNRKYKKGKTISLMTTVVQFSISNRNALRGKFWSSTFVPMGGCLPFGRQQPQVQIFSLFSHSLLSSAVEVISNFCLPGALLWDCSEGFCLLFLSKAYFWQYSYAVTLSWQGKKPNSDFCEVQIYSYSLAARKQRLDSLSKLLCSPHWNLYSALFPSCPLYMSVTKQSYSIFWGWYTEHKI